MSETAVRALLGERIVRQGLADRPCPDVVSAVARTTAIQAQDTPASLLGVRARSVTVTESDVRTAVEVSRVVVRTWLMRGTIHLVTARDLRWLVELIGPAIRRKYRTRWQQLGLTDAVLEASLAALPQILRDGPLDRHQIRAALVEHGVGVRDGTDPQVHTHVVVHACTTGLVCRGPDRGRVSTFALVDDWLIAPAAPDANARSRDEGRLEAAPRRNNAELDAGPRGDDALAELARRYFSAYSPATAADFTTWSGLAGGHAVRLIRDELTECDVDGRSGYRLGEVAPQAGMRLLPAFDNYLVGYADRTAIVATRHRPAVYQGGMIRPVVLVDGSAVGTWRIERAAGKVVVAPWRRLTRAEHGAVEAEVADLGRFLDRQLVPVVEPAW